MVALPSSGSQVAAGVPGPVEPDRVAGQPVVDAPPRHAVRIGRVQAQAAAVDVLGGDGEALALGLRGVERVAGQGTDRGSGRVGGGGSGSGSSGVGYGDRRRDQSGDDGHDQDRPGPPGHAPHTNRHRWSGVPVVCRRARMISVATSPCTHSPEASMCGSTVGTTLSICQVVRSPARGLAGRRVHRGRHGRQPGGGCGDRCGGTAPPQQVTSGQRGDG